MVLTVDRGLHDRHPRPILLETPVLRADHLRMFEFFVGYGLGAGSGMSRKASLARSTAVGEASSQLGRIEDLADEVDRLLVIVRAMWTLLEEKGFSPEELKAEIERIESRELAKPMPSDCPSCGSKVAPGLTACQFCGAAVELVADASPI